MGIKIARQEAQQYLLMARYYSPETAFRFLSVDPLGLDDSDMNLPHTMNRYAYVRNNPIAGVDRDGGRFERPAGNTELGRRQNSTLDELMVESPIILHEILIHANPHVPHLLFKGPEIVAPGNNGQARGRITEGGEYLFTWIATKDNLSDKELRRTIIEEIAHVIEFRTRPKEVHQKMMRMRDKIRQNVTERRARKIMRDIYDDIAATRRAMKAYLKSLKPLEEPKKEAKVKVTVTF